MNHDAIRAVHPNAYIIDDGEGAFDIDGKKISIDETAVAAKAIELKAQRQAELAVEATKKQAAEAKLAKLGLTPEDLKALLG